MSNSNSHLNFDSRVAMAPAQYPSGSEEPRQVSAALEQISRALGWGDEERGPLAQVVPSGSRVLIKPNFVLHANQGPWDMEPMVTHQSLIKVSVEAALRAGAREVVVGDAPIQSCDFDELLAATNLDEWSRELQQSETRFKGIRDFRRTICKYVDGVRLADEDLLPADQFLLFDLADESLLEPISRQSKAFRVTCYDPRLMAETHSPGRHRYLVAKDVMNADVVINLPKLKTHKKAGITCALKNLIGINGNKEYLPHHRVGGAENGGDCYPGRNPIKRAIEYVSDRENMAATLEASRAWHDVNRQLGRVLRITGGDPDIEGSWSGNNTIWRTGLDLNRILLYGKADGAMAETIQRRVVHLVDAIVAGQGDGPLSPQPLPLGLMFAGANAAAVDLIGARLLGYDPQQIAIVREAFGDFRWPLTSFRAEDIRLLAETGSDKIDRFKNSNEPPLPVIYPKGWADAASRKWSSN